MLYYRRLITIQETHFKDVEKKELIVAIKTLFNGNNYFSNNLPKDIQNWVMSENGNRDIVLTRREKEILELLAKGRTTLQMAQQLKPKESLRIKKTSESPTEKKKNRQSMLL